MTVPFRATEAPPLDARRDTLVARLAERAGKLGVKTQWVSGLDEAATIVARLVEAASIEARRAVIAPGLDAARPALRQRLLAHGVNLSEIDPADPARSFAGVTVGVSEATGGIAETGSLIVADPPADRLVRMLSPKHVVLLDAARIVPGLDEAGEFLHDLIAGRADEGSRPAAGTALRPGAPFVSFITGPSRTADIEMSLTVGAHGPAELHIVVLNAERGARSPARASAE